MRREPTDSGDAPSRAAQSRPWPGRWFIALWLGSFGGLMVVLIGLHVGCFQPFVAVSACGAAAAIMSVHAKSGSTLPANRVVPLAGTAVIPCAKLIGLVALVCLGWGAAGWALQLEGRLRRGLELDLLWCTMIASVFWSRGSRGQSLEFSLLTLLGGVLLGYFGGAVCYLMLKAVAAFVTLRGLVLEADLALVFSLLGGYTAGVGAAVGGVMLRALFSARRVGEMLVTVAVVAAISCGVVLAAVLVRLLLWGH